MCTCNDNNKDSMLKQVFMIIISIYFAILIFKWIYEWYTSLSRKERKMLWITVAAVIIIAQFFE